MTSTTAISLKTTGLDPSQDQIIQVSASVLRDNAITDRFSELVKSDSPISPGIVKLTGISAAMLDDARPADAVFADFMAFLPADTRLIAHGGTFVSSFLRHATQDAFSTTILDTRELSAICYPSLPSHGLDNLKEDLDLAACEGDSDTVLALWQRCVETSNRFPPALVKQINRMLNPYKQHPYAGFFQEAGQQDAKQDSSAPIAFGDLFREESLPKPRDIIDDEEQSYLPLDEQHLAGIFGPTGEFALKLQGYEHREEQVNMTRSVGQAFNNDQHLFVEAGTGIGKSLAYLVPAVLWATRNQTPVIVSTNTKNLQSQLFKKDLPMIRDVLGLDFKAALIKGRGNYLCLRKLLQVLRNADYELEREERIRMVGVLTWATMTQTGDVSENSAWARTGLHGLGSKLTSTGEECLGRACRQNRRCFLRRARGKSLTADVVVANHALVFAEMNIKSPALPPYAHIIFDEAHNLEEAATQFFSVEISESRIRFILNRIYRPKKKKPTGLLLSVMQQIESGASAGDAELRQKAADATGKMMKAIKALGPHMDACFNSLQTALDNDKDTRRIRPDQKREEIWGPITETRKTLVCAIGRIIDPAILLIENLRDMESDSLPFNQAFIRDIEAMIQLLREFIHDIEFVMNATEEGYVYWVTPASPRQGGARAWAAPLAVGQKLAEQLYGQKRAIVFSSATLSVRGSFNYLKRRLGVDLIEPERLMEMNAGTPFDYPNQCKIMVPMFLPDPTDRNSDYKKELALLMSEVFRRTRGRGMVLFTSYDMLKGTTRQLEDELLGDGIQVLAQGLSGSRESIMATFKQDLESVLMGTHSFWEGVDMVGETLSCLTIARLPFAVFTEPIVEARCEQITAEGGDAFTGYSLPSAVIRFRQGFGRLIRHRTDRGIVIVADKRISTKRYGGWFRNSLPAPTAAIPDRDTFLQAVESFLAEG